MTHSESETAELGGRLATELVPDGLLLLYGDLGSGKTVLIRGLAAGLGIDPDQVQSPTFTLIREHAGRRGRLVHVDLYRLSPDEVEGLGLDELLTGPGVKAIEWSERLPRRPNADLRLKLERDTRPSDRREIRELEAEDERKTANPDGGRG